MNERGHVVNNGLVRFPGLGRRLLLRVARRLQAYFVPPPSSRPYAALAKLCDMFDGSGPAPQVLYLGDSVVERVSRDDQDRRDLRQLLQAELSDHIRVESISHSACHMTVYSYLLQCLGQLPRRPAVVVIHVNLRSFSPQWDLDPAYQFEGEIAALKAFASGRNASVEVPQVAVSREKYEEFDATRVSYALSPLNSIGSFGLLVDAHARTEAQLAFRRQQILIYYYTHQLVASHRKVVALSDVLANLTRLGIRALVYVTPVNHEAGTRYVGSEFLCAVRRNVAVLESVAAPYVASGSTQFVDWSTMLPASCFFHTDFMNEHLNIEGRRLLADHIATRVRQLSVVSRLSSARHGEVI